MAGRPQQRTIETRRRILEVTRELVAEQGADATSVEAIAARAGVAKATVFAHFADKTNLLISLRLADLDVLSANMIAAVDRLENDGSRRSAVDEVIALLLPWLALYREDPEFARLFLIQSTLKDGPHTRQFIEACGGMEAQVGRALHILAGREALREGTDVAVIIQGVMAFYYHVIVGVTLCQIHNEAEQIALLHGLLTRIF